MAFVADPDGTPVGLMEERVVGAGPLDPENRRDPVA